MINFQTPLAFLLLLLIPLLFILRKLHIFNIITFRVNLGDWNGKHFIWNGKLQKFLSVIATSLVFISFTLVVLAFADPVKVHQEKVYTSLGTDIVFVLDTSPSMAAKDINGLRRIDAAKDAIRTLALDKNGNRYGIVEFGSNASVAVPPTSDLDFFTGILSELDVGAMGNGSAIGDGLSTAIYHLSSSKAENKCIILLTDGENNAGAIHPETASELASSNNINLYVVGIGSKGKVPIEYTDPITGKLYSGHLNSDYSFDQLRKIATIGNGGFFEVKTIGDLQIALLSVSNTEAVTQDFTYKTKNKTYYDKFILVALILISIAWFIKRIVLKEYISFKFRKILYVKEIFIALSFIMLLLAYSGISWGTYLVPVQKNSAAVSMVFDISNSMLAEDSIDGMSRLKASSIYAKKLLENMEGIPTSVILAKGDGMASIPLTEDTAIIDSLLDVMSPKMMTSPGTSLGKGILKAKDTFPSNTSTAGRIWLFTDGEETDKELTAALSSCVQSGIPVSIIGFGSETPSQILAGDGKTVIYTALRSGDIEKAIDKASEKYSFYKKHAELSYIKATDKGSATKLLKDLHNEIGENIITTYETKPIPRYRLFILLAIIFFALNFIVSEVDWNNDNKKKGMKKNSLNALLIFSLVIVLSSCSGNTSKILSGTYSWHKREYKHAISKFMNVVDDASKENNCEELDYSLYDLGTAYLMVGEDQAALSRFNSVSINAPQNVQYAAFYNAGVLSYKNGNYEEAKDYFKKAVKADSSKIDAKINFELSSQMIDSQGNMGKKKSVQAKNDKNKNPDLENSIFEHIKENDKKQWKNSESTEPQDLSKDY